MAEEVVTIFSAEKSFKEFSSLVNSSKKIHLVREDNIESALQHLESGDGNQLLVVEVKEIVNYIKLLQLGLKKELCHLSKYKEQYNDLIEISSEYPDFIGCSNSVRNICRQIGIVAKSDTNVLIQGESGTGKEVVARTIHNISNRSKLPFVSINCAALPEGLLESELFGYAKGAFTGAVRDYQGRLKQAHGGTFLFDEICSMSLTGQAKLLRLLEEREYQPVGGIQTIKFDARVIATSNVNLIDNIKKNKFREDLFYRLSVFPIFLQPLRERKEDIHLLAGYFLKKNPLALKKNIKDFDPRTIALLLDHDWPGNVRELENCIEYGIMVEKTKHLQPSSLPLRPNTEYQKFNDPQKNQKTLRGKLIIIERELIIEALKKSNWIKKNAANLLGIDPKNMNYYLAKNRIIEPKNKHNIYV